MDINKIVKENVIMKITAKKTTTVHIKSLAGVFEKYGFISGNEFFNRY